MNRNAALSEANVRYRDMQEQEAFWNARIARAKAMAEDSRQNAIGNLTQSFIAKGIDPGLAQSLAIGGISNPEQLERALSEHDKRTMLEQIQDPNTTAEARTILTNTAVLLGYVPQPISAVGGAIVDRRALPAPGVAPTEMTPDQQAVTNQHAASANAPKGAPPGMAPLTPEQLAGARNEAIAIRQGRESLQSVSSSGAFRTPYAVQVRQFVMDPHLTDENGQSLPVFDQQTNNARLAARTQLQRDNTLVSGTTYYNHLQLLSKLGDALSTGNVPAANSLLQFLQRETGNADITNYNAAANLVADEGAKFYAGSSGGTEADREKFASALAAKLSGPQRQGAISTELGLMDGKLAAKWNQYNLVAPSVRQQYFPEGFTPPGAVASPAAAPAAPTIGAPSGTAVPAPAAAPAGNPHVTSTEPSAPLATPSNGAPSAPPPAGAPGAQPAGAVNADEAALQQAAARWAVLPPQAPHVPPIGSAPTVGVPPQ